MNNPLTTKLLHYAMDHHILVKVIPGSSTLPCVAILEANLIVINANYQNSKQIPFQIAHEIAHFCLEKDTTLYRASACTFRTWAEKDANQLALEIILPFYLELTNYSINSVYPVMRQLALPEHLTENVQAILQQELSDILPS